MTGRSYLNIMMGLRRALSANANCVAGSNLGDARLLHPIDHQAVGKPGGRRLPTAARTRVAGKESPVSVLWTNIWEGNRPGDKVERLRLYRRDIE